MDTSDRHVDDSRRYTAPGLRQHALYLARRAQTERDYATARDYALDAIARTRPGQDRRDMTALAVGCEAARSLLAPYSTESDRECARLVLSGAAQVWPGEFCDVMGGAL